MAKHWYIVHAYSNFEQKVADSIEEGAASAGLSDSFEEILVPTEEVVEMRRGRRVNAERKFFPGYVLVKMDMTDEAYHLVKNTPKVTGFFVRKTSLRRLRKVRLIASLIRFKRVLSVHVQLSCFKLVNKFACRMAHSHPLMA